MLDLARLAAVFVVLNQRRQTPRGRVWATGYVATALPLQLAT